MALKVGGVTPERRHEIRVIGIGGGGCNAVASMIEASKTKKELQSVDYMVANLDGQALQDERFRNVTVLSMGEYGAGTDPEKGRTAMEKKEKEVRRFIQGAKLLFIAAAMGGGTGTGGAPVVARIAREEGVTTIGVITLPFRAEGMDRMRRAADGVVSLFQHTQSVLVVDNERLREHFSSITLDEGFRRADEVLAQAVESVVYVIRSKGHVNVDINDIRNVLQRRLGPIGMGQVELDSLTNLNDAVRKALDRPFLLEQGLHSARYKMIYIAYGTPENQPSVNILSVSGANEGEVVFGYAHDPSLGNKIRVNVIAVGFSYDQAVYNDAEKLLRHLNRETKEADPNFAQAIDWRAYQKPAFLRSGITLPPIPEEYKEVVL